MRTGKVAKALGLDRKTVINWTEMPQFKKFFSPDALGIDRTQRDYHESDLLVLNTILMFRTTNEPWADIAKRLERGERQREMPASAMLVETTAPIAQYGRIIELQSTIEAQQRQIEQLENEIERLQERIEIVRDEERQKTDEERQKARERERQLINEIIDLNKVITRLEVQMEVLQKQDDEEGE